MEVTELMEVVMGVGMDIRSMEIVMVMAMEMGMDEATIHTLLHPIKLTRTIRVEQPQTIIHIVLETTLQLHTLESHTLLDLAI